ncbi:DUF1194 domain-containing protein [Nitratireductor sp. CAU 1489]|uniref:DUF1194 domain-containing protein n=1 Tax=Nitratireductor arenosus TaxID=2682096 RepID=A0A844QDD3_9HYPH|nr:DUF1194 domain-containing protein [Nitratireductor arenosus]
MSVAWSPLAGLVFVALVLGAPANGVFGGEGGEAVDVELVLAVDVSSSMTADELALQRRGYIAALRSPEVLRAIENGRHGRVAVTYVEWGASNSRRVLVPWTLIDGMAQAERVAALLERAPVRNLFQTSIAGAIRHSMRAFADSGFRGTRRVIDISGDGPNNQGGMVAAWRDIAVENGITINGLPMILEGRAFGDETIALLEDYYSDCVIGGPRAFILPVRDWDHFAEAVRWKLVLELSGVAMPVLTVANRTGTEDARGVDCLIGEKMWSGMEQD